jgi:hypothetical protein
MKIKEQVRMELHEGIGPELYRWCDLINITKTNILIVNPIDDFYMVASKKMVKGWRWA